MHVDTRTFAGAFLVGLAMFATLFLGVVLAVFLTLGVVSGDAERGLLQPLVVRPVGRGDAAPLALRRRGGVVCVVYVLARLLRRDVDHGADGALVAGPDRLRPASSSPAASSIVIALSLLGSVVLSSTANGIAVFMLFGAGLVAGLLGSIGHALNSHAIKHASTIAVVGAAVRGALPGRAAHDHREHVRASPASCSSSGRSAARTCTAGRSASGRSSTSSLVLAAAVARFSRQRL